MPGMLRTWSNGCPLEQPGSHCSIACVTIAQGRAIDRARTPRWPVKWGLRGPHPPWFRARRPVDPSQGPGRPLNLLFRYSADPIHPRRPRRIRGDQPIVPDLLTLLDAGRKVHYRTAFG